MFQRNMLETEWELSLSREPFSQIFGNQYGNPSFFESITRKLNKFLLDPS